MSKSIPSFAHLQPMMHPQGHLQTAGATLIAGQMLQQGQMKYQRIQAAAAGAHEVVMADGEILPMNPTTPPWPSS